MSFSAVEQGVQNRTGAGNDSEREKEKCSQLDQGRCRVLVVEGGTEAAVPCTFRFPRVETGHRSEWVGLVCTFPPMFVAGLHLPLLCRESTRLLLSQPPLVSLSFFNSILSLPCVFVAFAFLFVI